MVLPQRPRRHEDWAIATIHPLPADAPFPNVRDVLEEFIVEHRQLGLRDIQRCLFGEAYVRLTRVRDRDKLVLDSPHEFGDVFITFVKHDEGRNHRRVHFNRTVWLLLTGVPFDFRNTEDLACAVSKFGRMISWDKEDDHMGRIVVKARVMNLDIIPKSMRWSEGDEFEEDGWSSSIEVLASELLGGGPADEDPFPPANVDPHPLPEDAEPAHGFHDDVVNNNDMDVQIAENWDNWEENQQNNQNAELEDLLDVVQQEEMAWADGEELLPAPSNSSLSSDMSFSEGDNSNMLLPPVAVEVIHPRAAIPAIIHSPAIVIANGLQNIIQAYQSDDEEPPLLQEQTQDVALVDVVLHDQVVADQLQHVASNSHGAHVTVDVSASMDVAPFPPVLLEAALEPVLISALPLAVVPHDGKTQPSLASGSSNEVLACSTEHVNTARGSLQPVENLEDLQSGLQGNWVNQINEHFSMAPSLLGLKCIQMAAATNNEHSVSEEGMLLWKQHFKEQSLESRSSFSTNIPVSWFNFIVHLLLSPDKFAWTVNMLKSGMWELFTAVENMDQAILFHIPDKCPTSHAPICQAMEEET